ncbi:MAG: GNAT family N-acetyltransferase [Oscillatoriales cyanobacterium SM2_2_1]|nr:GNAT family N-acetyltransferase [Oscillatoriales cyanobacterium SM2_2_1]
MSPYQFKLATSPEEMAAYFELRKIIFVQEQQLFQGSDVDAIDEMAYPIIAIHTRSSNESSSGSSNGEIVGVVRIYETQPGTWYGGRLGTHPDHRKGWSIGKGLIYRAVTTANSWGCTQFLATVQLQNIRFFQRLHWHSLGELIICHQPHHLMKADLNFYPPTSEIRPILPLQNRGVS